MLKLFLYRILQAIPVLLGVSLVVFVLVRLGGDPTTLMLGLEAPPEQVAQLRNQLGLDRPLPVQYIEFLRSALAGDFGTSLRHEQPAMQLVVERLPATLQLAAAGLGAAILIAIPLGVLAAVARGTLVDRSLTVVALAGQSLPSFWLGLVLILVVGVQWRLLPVSGSGTWRHLILPAVTLGAFSVSMLFRLMRSTMIDAFKRDYIRTARAKGLSERNITWRHAFRNATIPVLTVLSVQLSALLGGAIIVEAVFAYPGMGQLAVQAINNRDFPIVQSFVLLLALFVTAINLLTDLLYGLLDPRIAYD